MISHVNRIVESASSDQVELPDQLQLLQLVGWSRWRRSLGLSLHSLMPRFWRSHLCFAHHFLLYPPLNHMSLSLILPLKTRPPLAQRHSFLWLLLSIWLVLLLCGLSDSSLPSRRQYLASLCPSGSSWTLWIEHLFLILLHHQSRCCCFEPEALTSWDSWLQSLTSWAMLPCFCGLVRCSFWSSTSAVPLRSGLYGSTCL